MPFNTLMVYCLLDKLSFGEQGVQVSAKRQSDETVLFFRIDEGQGSPFCRRMSYEGKLCDLLVYYHKNNSNSGKIERVLWLIELKRGKRGDASAQLDATREIFNEKFKEMGLDREIALKGYIRSHGSSPLDHSNVKRLKDIFGKNNIKISSSNNFDDVLRDRVRTKYKK